MKKERLGRILIRKGLVTQEDVDAAFRLQVGGRRRMGYLLIKMGKIKEDQLIQALSDQLDIPTVHIEEEFNSDVKNVLPRYLCRRYSVLPLEKEKNNVLKLAMVDPLDYEAIKDIEAYTGNVVRQVISTESDVSKSIGRFIPFSIKEAFNPHLFSNVVKGLAAAVLILFLVLGLFLYSEVRRVKFGEFSQVQNAKIFKNHDLMVRLDQEGRISLLGQGAYSQGYFSVIFDDSVKFKEFVLEKRDKFSEKQFTWLLWVASKRISNSV